MLEVYDNDILWCTYMYYIGLYRTVKCEQKYRWTNQPSCVSRWLGGWWGGSVSGDGTQSTRHTWDTSHKIEYIYLSHTKAIRTSVVNTDVDIVWLLLFQKKTLLVTSTWQTLNYLTFLVSMFQLLLCEKSQCRPVLWHEWVIALKLRVEYIATRNSDFLIFAFFFPYDKKD